MNFRLQLHAMLSGLPWQHDFDSPSAEMAKTTAQKWLAQPGNIPPECFGAYLFDMTSEKLVAYFEIERSISVSIKK